MENVYEELSGKTANNKIFSQKKKNAEKIKITIYLTEEAEVAFTELYIHRLRKDRKTDKSQIACEALIALYESECVSK